MTDFARARRTMVDNQLRTSGITDWRILDVMNKVPRELFVPEERRELAYIDEHLPLADGRALPAPASLARLIQLAEIAPNEHVLVVGCGTGYAAAVIAKLGASVVGLEEDAALAAKAGEILAGQDGNAIAVSGSLNDGAADNGPYDVILIEGAVDVVPDALLAQLKEGGRLIAVIGQGHAGVSHVFVRSGTAISSRAAFNVGLPPISAFAKTPEFQF